MKHNDNNFVRLDLIQERDSADKELVLSIGKVVVFFAESKIADDESYRGDKFSPQWLEDIEDEYMVITDKDIDSDTETKNRWMNILVAKLTDQTCTADYYLEMFKGDSDVELYSIAVLAAAVKANEEIENVE